METEGIWKWTDDTSFSFTGWRKNNPIGAKDEPNGGRTENCLELIHIVHVFIDYYWNDRDCSDTMKYICKISK